jgi:hypothetical protein
MNSQNENKRGYGCLPYGCFIAISLILLVGGGISYLVISNIRGAVEQYTAAQPISVPSAAMSAEAAKGLQAKLAEMARIANDDGGSGELVLSSDELAALVTVSPFNGKVSAQLVGDEVSATFSFKMSDLGDWSSGQWLLGSYLDRYVNGSGKATLALVQGEYRVDLKALTLNQRVFEDAALKGASQWVSGALNTALAGPAMAPQALKFVTRVERVWIADSLFHLKVGPLKQ